MNGKKERKEISNIVKVTVRELHPLNHGWYYQRMLEIVINSETWIEALEEVKTRSEGFKRESARMP